MTEAVSNQKSEHSATPTKKSKESSAKKQKAPTFSKNGVRMGRPPGTKNKPNPNGPKVGRPSLSTIFMRQHVSLSQNSTANNNNSVTSSGVYNLQKAGNDQLIGPTGNPIIGSRDANLSINGVGTGVDAGTAHPGIASVDEGKELDAIQLNIDDAARQELGLEPFDPTVRFKHRNLAKRQKCRFAVIPIYSKEERQLFAEIIKDKPLSFLNWVTLAKQWNPRADGRVIFYKLPEHLSSYFQLLQEAGLTHAAQTYQHATGIRTPDGLASHLHNPKDMSGMIFAVALTAASMSGSGITKDSLVTARMTTSPAALENTIASLNSDSRLYSADGSSSLTPSGKKRGRRPGSKNVKPKKRLSESDISAAIGTMSGFGSNANSNLLNRQQAKTVPQVSAQMSNSTSRSESGRMRMASDSELTPNMTMQSLQSLQSASGTPVPVSGPTSASGPGSLSSPASSEIFFSHNIVSGGYESGGQYYTTTAVNSTAADPYSNGSAIYPTNLRIMRDHVEPVRLDPAYQSLGVQSASLMPEYSRDGRHIYHGPSGQPSSDEVSNSARLQTPQNYPVYYYS
ncbi:hypothetical protein V1511DRAFT_486370 [Dipodascopsis uninucleata]